MRTFVKMILPVAAFMLASAGAVSTNKVSDKAEKATVAMSGYLHTTSNPCQEISVNCQTVNNGQVCQASGQSVYRLTAPGFCPNLLWKVIP